MELARLAAYRARAARLTGTSTIVTSRLLSVFALLSSLLVAAPVLAQTNAQADPSFPDLRTLVLSASEMPGYVVDANRSSLQDRQDGTSSYDAVYTRDPA